MKLASWRADWHCCCVDCGRASRCPALMFKEFVMQRWFGQWFVVGFGFLLMAGPALAQTKNCTAGSSSSSSTTTSGTASTTSTASGGSSTTTGATLARIQMQITQLQALLNQLLSGQVSAASSGMTNAQAAVVVQSRINTLQQLANQIRSNAAVQNQRGAVAAGAVRRGR